MKDRTEFILLFSVDITYLKGRDRDYEETNFFIALEINIQKET